MRLLALALALLALGPAAPAGWRTFAAGGVSFRYPPGWFATARPLTAVTSPRQVVAVASYRFQPDVARADGCEPKEALDRLPPDGAFVYGWEDGQVTAKPRPAHFSLGRSRHGDCLGAGPGYTLSFSDHGSAFTVEIAFGTRATTVTRAAVLRILDSFRSA